MKRAISEFVHLTGLWFILRVNPRGAARIMEKWSEALHRNRPKRKREN